MSYHHFFMRNPKLVFTISKKIDLEVALAFRTVKAGGVDFRKWGLLAPHPDLRIQHLTPIVMTVYTERFYREHGKDLKKACLGFVRTWQGVSKTFFSLTKALFGSGFPGSGTYTCYSSMWNCNTRDISHRAFQVFYRNDNPVEIMTHEMLHFAFYEYIFKRYPNLKDAKHSMRLWELSEAFNTIVLNSPEWRKRLRTRRQSPYPALQDLVRTMRRRWTRSQSLNAMLDGFLVKKEGASVCSRRV